MQVYKLLALTAAIGSALACRAADYPAATGYVNDFAGMLSAPDRQALETRLRAYERATSNEVAVAITPSLDGQSVEEYARGLFWAWGIGKKQQNNGVLFLWAPTERKVRIQVGYGLTSVLTDEAAADILREVTPRLRQGEYAAGVNAAVDGILARLGNSPPAAGGEPETPSPPSRAGWLAVGAILLGVVGLAIAWRWADRRKRALEIPVSLDRARQFMGQAEAYRVQASKDLESLRQEAPRHVWEGFETAMAAAPAVLATLNADIQTIEAHPIAEYRDLRAVSRQLEKWHREMAGCAAFAAKIHTTLESFRESRDQAQSLLGSVAATLSGFESRAAAAPSERPEKLLAAARETWNAAYSASAENPANWLMVHDLLMDVQACLNRLEWQLSPGSRWTAPARFERRWPGSQQDSSAAEALLLMQANWNSTSSDSSSFDSGSSSGGSDFGGFGGGDTGGGGASDSY